MQRSLRIVCILTLSLLGPILASPAPARAGSERDSIATALNTEYMGKVLIQRQFLTGTKISYDSSGNPIGHARPGPWTTEAELRVTSIRLPDDKTIVIDAERLLLVADKANGFHDALLVIKVPEKEKKFWEKVRKLQISIASDQEFDLASGRAAFAKIFLLATEHLSDFVPSWWKPAVRQYEQGPASAANSGKSAAPHSGVLKVDYPVHPPRARSMPEPKYAETARLMRYQGTVVLWLVVNEQGLPREITIDRALGLGLDETAVEAVSKWRFDPATKDGQPVAARINVEVNFRLY